MTLFLFVNTNNSTATAGSVMSADMSANMSTNIMSEVGCLKFCLHAIYEEVQKQLQWVRD